MFTRHLLPSVHCFPALPIRPLLNVSSSELQPQCDEAGSKSLHSQTVQQTFCAALKAANKAKYWLCWSHCRIYPNSRAAREQGKFCAGWTWAAGHLFSTSLQLQGHTHCSTNHTGRRLVFIKDLTWCYSRIGFSVQTDGCFDDEGEGTDS